MSDSIALSNDASSIKLTSRHQTEQYSLNQSQLRDLDAPQHPFFMTKLVDRNKIIYASNQGGKVIGRWADRKDASEGGFTMNLKDPTDTQGWWEDRRLGVEGKWNKKDGTSEIKRSSGTGSTANPEQASNDTTVSTGIVNPEELAKIDDMLTTMKIY